LVMAYFSSSLPLLCFLAMRRPILCQCTDKSVCQLAPDLSFYIQSFSPAVTTLTNEVEAIRYHT
jgi:hypothetical protein